MPIVPLKISPVLDRSSLASPHTGTSRLSGPAQRLDLGAAGNRAAAAPVIEIDAELRHAPDALAPAVVDDDGGRLEPDLAQVGAGVLAAAGARGGLRQDLDEVDAAERPVDI